MKSWQNKLAERMTYVLRAKECVNLNVMLKYLFKKIKIKKRKRIKRS